MLSLVLLLVLLQSPHRRLRKARRVQSSLPASPSKGAQESAPEPLLLLAASSSSSSQRRRGRSLRPERERLLVPQSIGLAGCCYGVQSSRASAMMDRQTIARIVTGRRSQSVAHLSSRSCLNNTPAAEYSSTYIIHSSSGLQPSICRSAHVAASSLPLAMEKLRTPGVAGEDNMVAELTTFDEKVLLVRRPDCVSVCCLNGSESLDCRLGTCAHWFVPREYYRAVSST